MQVVKSYNPALVTNRTVRSSSTFQFSWTANVDGITTFPVAQLLAHRPHVPVYAVSFELKVVEAVSNTALPLSDPGAVCFPNLVGWEVSSCTVTNVGTVSNPNVYIIFIKVQVDQWKTLNEQAVSSILVVLSFCAFGMTWRNIMQVGTEDRPRSISDLLTMPLGIGGLVGAVRAIFPAESPMQLCTDEAFYCVPDPLILLLVWCAFVAILMMSASAVHYHAQLLAWAHSSKWAHPSHRELPTSSIKEDGHIALRTFETGSE
ncbi:hypothetical protein FRB97_001212 [Tulasnella sp. 331]|nr:hypothetical protein FRB97_001212 [Tulasnella sp. 331]